MFCSQCGKELPDGAKFCPDCGMNVSEPVVNKIIQLPEEPGQEFWITQDYSVKFSFPMCQCIKVRAPFEKSGDDLYVDFLDWINEQCVKDNVLLVSFDQIYGVAFEEYLNRLEPQFHMAHRVLLDHGIDNLSFNEVKTRAQKAIDDRFGGLYLRHYFKPKAQVEEVIQTLHTGRETERSSRSHWEGGGFGIKGAIKGSVKAGMMNMATGMVRGIGDSFVDAGDVKRVEEYKKKVINESKTHPLKYLAHAMRGSVQDLGFYVCQELVSANCIPDVRMITFQEAKAKADNTMLQYQEGAYSKDIAIQKLCDIIAAQPFDNRVTAFRCLYKIDSRLKDNLLKLGEYLGIEQNVKDWFSWDEKENKQTQ